MYAVAPRNFILLQDGSLCLLDWTSAGFYPRFFESCVLWITRGMRGSVSSDVLKQAKAIDGRGRRSGEVDDASIS